MDQALLLSEFLQPQMLSLSGAKAMTIPNDTLSSGPLQSLYTSHEASRQVAGWTLLLLGHAVGRYKFGALVVLGGPILAAGWLLQAKHNGGRREAWSLCLQGQSPLAEQ